MGVVKKKLKSILLWTTTWLPAKYYMSLERLGDDIVEEEDHLLAKIQWLK